MTTKKKRSAHTDNDSWVVIAPGTLHFQVYCGACNTRFCRNIVYIAQLILLRLCNNDKCCISKYANFRVSILLSPPKSPCYCFFLKNKSKSSQSQSQLYCQFCHMYRTYIQRIEIALLSYSLVHTDNTKHKQ